MKKLFYDPYLTECKSVVNKISGNKVWLEQSCFFAFSGGQASDSGTIGEILVQEAIKDGDEIYYILEKEPDFKKGDTVKVRIDKERRSRLMRLHSSAHIVWHFLFNKIGRQKLIGSNMHPDKARLDIIFERPLTEIIAGLEKQVNDFISESHTIQTYPSKENPEKRLWKCDGIDLEMPCGGTHPKSTQEIGPVKLRRKNIGAGKERIEITLVKQ